MKETPIRSYSGIPMLLIQLAAMGLFGFLIVKGALNDQAILIVSAVLGEMLLLVLLCGFYMVEPNQAAVLSLFGKYIGTSKEQGLRWNNPFFSAKKVSLRTRNFESSKLKVNDLDGSPIEIASVVKWITSKVAVNKARIRSKVRQNLDTPRGPDSFDTRQIAEPRNKSCFLARRVDPIGVFIALWNPAIEIDSPSLCRTCGEAQLREWNRDFCNPAGVVDARMRMPNRIERVIGAAFAIFRIVSVESDARCIDAKSKSSATVVVRIYRYDELFGRTLIVPPLQVHPQFVGVVAIHARTDIERVFIIRDGNLGFFSGLGTLRG